MVTEKEPPVKLEVGEAIYAVQRCAFDTGDGRRVVHCFIGFIGADWDETAACREVGDSVSRGWFDTMWGRCLVVLMADGRQRTFDTVVPE